MQIFNDKKKRIGTLSGFRGRSITTTLNTGDKELSFEYPSNGKLVNLLKEECYIRTKTDEFVIKAVEKGEQFNKYTAVLNVEELEGTPFPYGFEAQEQTIRACLEFAFEGTGWTVRTCTVTKKRTINEEESVTAWDVLQKCLSTYRCECVIDSLNKEIDIFEQIGSDKGCYFMEGLNLRKLSPKSDTYEFYTRIYPIGKDGITPEVITGTEYIDNFQYSSKIKAFVWKDERYANTTSLVEDATAKLDEMSRPYKAFVAEIADIARISKKYKDILSYGIGDTVTLVSKRYKTREKQRIVKITEYPESPDKNTVEISNARKTFAQIQQEETESARTEAISISNRNTKKILADYSTTEEIETKITASKEAVELGVLHTLTSYYDKTETDALIEISKGEIALSVSAIYQTKDAMGEYSTTTETKALIDIASESIELSVSETLQNYSTTEEMNAAIKVNADAITAEVRRAQDKETELAAALKVNADAITAEVSRAQGQEVELAAALKVATDAITLKVSKGEISSQLSVESGAVAIKSNRFSWESSKSSLSSDGKLTAREVDLNGKITADSGEIGGFTISSNTLSAGNVSTTSGGVKLSTESLKIGGSSNYFEATRDGEINIVGKSSSIKFGNTSSAMTLDADGISFGASYLSNTARITKDKITFNNTYIDKDTVHCGKSTSSIAYYTDISGDEITLHGSSSSGYLKIGSAATTWASYSGTYYLKDDSGDNLATIANDRLTFVPSSLVLGKTGGSISFFGGSTPSTKKTISSISSTTSATASTIASKVNEIITALKDYNLIG